MKLDPSWLVYVAGIILLGFFLRRIEQTFSNDVLFFALVIGYLLLLRLVGDAISVRLRKK